MNWYIKCVVSKKPHNKKICKEVFWYKFISNCIEIFESYDIAKSFLNWIIKNPNKPNISDLSYVEKSYIKICDVKGITPTFPAKKKYIEAEYRKYLEHINYTCKIYKAKIANYTMCIPKYDLSRRRLLGYKWTVKEEVLSTIKHHILTELSTGNQWTMLDDKQIDFFKSAGHNIEVFGSPFNTRLQYFGSLYESDEPFGRIGTYQEILDTVEAGQELKWRNNIVVPINEKKIFTPILKLIISPPSGTKLLLDLYARCIRILNIRSAEIYVGVPTYDDTYINILKGKYFISSMIQDKSWDFYAVQKSKISKNTRVKNSVEIDMKGREWELVLLKS